MKRYLIIILLAALVNNTKAQTSAQIKDICSSVNVSLTVKHADYTTVTEAKTMIEDIIAVIGLKPNFEVQAGDVDNAAAVIYEGKRYILYNPDFINRLNTAAGNKWASISILAHEIGHHLNGHTLDNIGSRPDKELEADEFSGFVMRRMGATLADAQAAMKIAADYKPSLTHPGQADRLTAIATGWNTADKQQNGKDLAKTNPLKDDKRLSTDIKTTTNKPLTVSNENKTYGQLTSNIQRQPVNRKAGQQTDAALLVNGNGSQTSSNNRGVADRNILADLSFTAGEGSSYYLTSEFNIVKEMNNRLYVIGKMKATDSNDYPFLISDDAGTKLWVDNNGYIINSSNTKVGFMRVRK